MHNTNESWYWAAQAGVLELPGSKCCVVPHMPVVPGYGPHSPLTQYKDVVLSVSHNKVKTVSRPSYLYNGNPIPGKTVFIPIGLLGPGRTGNSVRSGREWMQQNNERSSWSPVVKYKGRRNLAIMELNKSPRRNLYWIHDFDYATIGKICHHL